MLAAEGNIRVANLTTPAQYFHLLRRQAKVAKQRPLDDHDPEVAAAPAAGDEPDRAPRRDALLPGPGEPRVPIDKVTRLVLCTGKVYYDLVGHPSRQDNEGVAVGRVELLYPFPESQIFELIRQLPEPARGRVGPGGAAQHGRPRAHVPAPDADPRPSTCTSATSAAPRRASPGEG
jgi:2-oxoglutarate dehydrogenase E1 component